MIEGLILLIVGIGAFAAFVVGVALLIMWYRAGQTGDYSPGEPIIYGDMVQCPHCGWMNPLDTAICLKCREPLALPPGYRPAAPASLPPAPYAPTAYGPPPAGATVRSPFAPPAPPSDRAPGMAEGTVRAAVTPPQPPAAAPGASPAQTVIAGRDSAAAGAAAGAESPASPGDAWLQVTAGALSGQRFPVGQTDTLFGRSTKCDVQIPDQKVSRKHFVIRYAQGGYYLQDQGSTSGTLVNGEPVEARRLADGDRIDLGDTTLVFHTR